jgi:hypothetical protein
MGALYFSSKALPVIGAEGGQYPADENRVPTGPKVVKQELA